MAKFLLVHGAWHGGWAWERVVPLLEARGHEVHAPDLAGCGARADGLAGGICLSTHVADIAAALEQSPEPVVLVGHSYGGMVITGAAARHPNRVAALVYLDAFAPLHGQSVFDAFSEGEKTACLRRAARDRGLFMKPTSAKVFNVNTADAAMIDARTAPFPLACFLEQVDLGDWTPPRTRHYLVARGWQFSTFTPIAKDLAQQPGWSVQETAAGHEMTFDAPGETADYLASLVPRAHSPAC